MIIWLYLIYIMLASILLVFGKTSSFGVKKKKEDLAMEIILNVTITNCSINKKKKNGSILVRV